MNTLNWANVDVHWDTRVPDVNGQHRHPSMIPVRDALMHPVTLTSNCWQLLRIAKKQKNKNIRVTFAERVLGSFILISIERRNRVSNYLPIEFATNFISD